MATNNSINFPGTGNAGDVQLNNGTGGFTSDPNNFQWNTSNHSLIAGYEAVNAAQGAYAIGDTANVSGTYGTAFGAFSVSVNQGSLVINDGFSTCNPDTVNQQMVCTFAGGYQNYVGATIATTIDANANWIAHSGQADQSYSYQTPVSPFSYTVSDDVRTLTIAPFATLASGTVTLPASPIDGQVVRVNVTKTITALTVNANAGHTINNPPTTLLAGQGFDVQFNISTGAWNPLTQPTGATSAAGTTNDIQVNNGGIFAADTGVFAWDLTYHSLTAGTGASTNSHTDAHAIGQGAAVTGSHGIAIGNNASAAGTTVALGPNTTTTGTYSYALGNGARATAQSATAIGFQSLASSNYAVAIGTGATASHAGSFVCSDENEAGADSNTNQWVGSYTGGYFFNINGTLANSIDTIFNVIDHYGAADQSYSRQVPTTGFSITIGAGVRTLTLAPAGTLATGTIVMPASPIDGQVVRVNTTQTITGLTVSGNSGQTINNPPMTLGAGQGFDLQYNLANTAWNPLYKNGGSAYLSVSVLAGSAVPLTSGSTSDICSINLPAGNWRVGAVYFLGPAGTTVTTSFFVGINTTSETLPTQASNGAYFSHSGSSYTGGNPGGPLGIARFSSGSAFTVYLSVLANFTTSTNAAYGYLWAEPA